MLLVNQLVGFGAGGLVEVLIDRTIGTNIGNMTDVGSLAQAFDGTTNSGFGTGAGRTATNGYVGKEYTAGKIFNRAIVYGPNDTGFVNGSNPSVTITIYGKNGAPASGTDGTSLGATGSFTDTGNESGGRTINATSPVTAYTHIWAYVDGGGAAAGVNVTELVLYELA